MELNIRFSADIYITFADQEVGLFSDQSVIFGYKILFHNKSLMCHIYQVGLD